MSRSRDCMNCVTAIEKKKKITPKAPGCVLQVSYVTLWDCGTGGGQAAAEARDGRIILLIIITIVMIIIIILIILITIVMMIIK